QRAWGWRSQTQHGQNTQTKRLLQKPGGTLMSSRRIWPAVTASRCSHKAARCQPSTKGLAGSSTGQACLRKVCRRRSARSVKAAASSSAGKLTVPLGEAFDRGEFFVGHLLDQESIGLGAVRGSRRDLERGVEAEDLAALADAPADALEVAGVAGLLDLA